MTALIVCIRFSACSNAMFIGYSNTSSVVVGWALAHQQTIVRYFGGLKPTLHKVRIILCVLLFILGAIIMMIL